MFKRSRNRITILIAGISSLLLIATILVIYISTFYIVVKRDWDMLEVFAKAYEENGAPTNMAPPDDASEEDVLFQSVSICAVAFSEEGSIKTITNQKQDEYTNKELVDVARKLLQSGDTKGYNSQQVYYIKEIDDFTLVMVMDNRSVGNTIRVLMVNTLIFGFIFILLTVMIAYILAGKIMKPLEDNAMRQKQFISDASHELKTPISAIQANLEVLQRQRRSGIASYEQMDRWMDNIAMESERMSALVKELLQLSRAENQMYEMSVLDFSALVEKNVLLFESMAYEKGRELRYDIQNGLYVQGNALKLEQVITILLDNSLKHAKGSGPVEVALHTTTDRNAKVLLEVRNPGMEITKEEQKRIFERFYQVDQARTNEHFGLGLAIAKSIMERHNGSISIDYAKSTEEGESAGGTVIFSVVLLRNKRGSKGVE